MQKVFRSFVAASGAVLLAFVPFQAHAGAIGTRVAESDTVADAISIEVGVAAKGSALYRALAGAGNRPVADQLSYRFEVPAEVAAEFAYRSIRSMIEAEVASQQKVITIPEDPRPPTGAGRVGQTQPRLNSCASVGVGTTSIFADVTYEYEYRYTRNTDGDKKPDADPEWVLTDAKLRMLADSDYVKCQ